MATDLIHSVQKFTFDIHSESRSKAWEIQNKFTRFIQEQLLPIVDTTFTEESPARVQVRIRKLELDLGKVRLQYFEKDILNEFKSELVKALRAAISEVHYFPSDGNEIITPEMANRDLVIYFLKTGHLPWWSPMSKRADFSIQKTFKVLMDQNPDQALQIFRDVAHLAHARARLSRQFSDETLIQWVEIIQPGSRGSMSTFLLDLISIFRQRPFLDLPSSDFRELMWQTVFAILVSLPGREYQIRTFIREVLLFLSQRHGVKVSVLASRIYGRAVELNSAGSFQSSFEEALRSMMVEFVDPNAMVHSGADSVIEGEKWLSLLELFLKSGELPSGQTLTRSQFLARLWQTLLSHMPLDTVKIFQESWQIPLSRRRIMEEFEPTRFIQIVEIAEPAHAPYIIGFAQEIGHVDLPGSKVSTRSTAFEKAKWEFIMNYLFIERGSAFNKRSFLKSTVMQISKRYHVDYGVFLRHLMSSIGQLEASTALRKEIPALLYQLYQEYEKDQTLRGKINPKMEVFYTCGERLELVTFYLVHGYVPWSDSQLVRVEHLEVMLRSLVEEEPKKIQSAIRKLPADQRAVLVHRLMQFPQDLIMMVRKVLPDLPLDLDTSGLPPGGSREEPPVANGEETERVPSAQEKERLVFLFLEQAEPSDRKWDVRTIEKWLLELITSKPRLLHDQLYRLQDLGERQAAWAETLSDFVLSQTVRLLQPSYASRIERYAEKLLEGLLKSEIARRPSFDQKKLKWTLIFDYLAKHPGGFELPGFIDHFLDSATQTFQVSDIRSKIRILRAVPAKSTPRPLIRGIKKTLTRLQRISRASKDQVEQEKKRQQKEQRERRQLEQKRLEEERARGEEPQGLDRLESDELGKKRDERKQRDKDKEKSKKEERELQKELTEGRRRQDELEEEMKEKLEKKLKEELEQKLRKEWDEARIITEPIYINNAGLVLFHPFLVQYFEILDLIRERKFVDQSAAVRAVHLLQYLVRRTEESPEYELPLNKVMCGLNVSGPIDRAITFTDKEIETSDSLVKGVIENWPVLKNMDPDQFRVSFLHREGKLEENVGGWSLTIEKRAYDVLMEKLPWSVSMVKLPWMSKMIHVQWH